MRTRIFRMRTLLVIVLLLIGGAIINVAVAWGCVCWSSLDPSDDRSVGHIEWRAPVPVNWPPTASYMRNDAFGITDFNGVSMAPLHAHELTGGTEQRVFQAGWPFRSLYLERHRTTSMRGFSMPLNFGHAEDWRHGIRIPEWIPWCSEKSKRDLPTRLIWFGFAMNAIFYGAILWPFVAVLFALGRRLRIKSGLCPKCAYPTGVSDTCTECGKPVKRKIVTQKAGAA